MNSAPRSPEGDRAVGPDSLRLATVVTVVVLVVVAVLALAIWGLRYERVRLLEEFGVAQQDVAKQLAVDLAKELDELDDDARLVATLVSRAESRPTMSAAEVKLLTLAGFDALATVVRHYRALALYRGSDVAVNASDPSERAPMNASFQEWSAHAAGEARHLGTTVLTGPREAADGRQFFVYARPLAPDQAVVLVAEARLLLQPVLRSQGQHLRYFLIDPSRAVWLGCSKPATCRAFTSAEWAALPAVASVVGLTARPAGRAWDWDMVPSALGLPRRRTAIGWDSVERNGRRWTVGVVASALGIEARERSLLAWLVATSTALAAILGVAAAVMVRNQRRAASLAERLRHAQEISHLRERTEKLFENVSVGMAGVTRDGKVALTNRFLDQRAAIAPGTSMAQALGGANPQAAAEVAEALADALRTGRSHTLRGDQVRFLPTTPGHFDLRIIPLQQPAADVSALVLLEDLSELKSLEKQLVRAEKLITVGVLTAGLAHEIGTPLGIIRGRAELMLGKVKEAALARDLEAMVRQIDQIGSTIRQVLDFAHTQPVELKPVQPRDAVTAAASMLEWRFRQKSISYRANVPAALPPMAADPDQLQQVLVNVLLNAADACAEMGSISMSARPGLSGGAIVLEIRDDGCGIAPEDLNAVFDPYFTTKKRGEGTGLGLPVAAAIVRNHGGEIILRSEPGVGTTVAITWPVATEKARIHA